MKALFPPPRGGGFREIASARNRLNRESNIAARLIVASSMIASKRPAEGAILQHPAGSALSFGN